ncbi:MAG: hypothetical protein JNK38_10600 [Acidobacteria bacterium]|nr:hypothetical protein [Acidobacteriota bacterium]
MAATSNHIIQGFCFQDFIVFPSTRGILAQQNRPEIAALADLTSFTNSLPQLNQLYPAVGEYDYAMTRC